MNRRTLTCIAAALTMLILILDAKTALSGAVEGVQLCIQVVIPSLLPLFFLSIFLTDALSSISTGFLTPLGRFCRIPGNTPALLVLGLLGGYPTGAQSVAEAYRAGHLSKEDGKRLLGFCSNAGPAFVFAMGATQFQDPRIPMVLWLIHILSALITGRILPSFKSKITALPPKNSSISPTAAMGKTLRTLGFVCGWVILFRVLLTFMDRWFLWYFPEELRTAIHIFLELANGCTELNRITNEGLRMMLFSAGLGFGGICVLMQTVSVTGSLGLGMYLPGKLIQCVLSLLLTWLWQRMTFSDPVKNVVIIPLSAVILAVAMVFLYKSEKRGRNSALLRV